MFRVATTCVLALVVGQVAFTQTIWMTYAFQKQYTSKITDSARSPTWEKDAENPPLSARKAINLATKMKDSLVKDGERYKWELESLALHPLPSGRWVWVAKYEARFQRYIGRKNELGIVVMMDGTVIKPEVSDSTLGDEAEPEESPNSK